MDVISGMDRNFVCGVISIVIPNVSALKKKGKSPKTKCTISYKRHQSNRGIFRSFTFFYITHLWVVSQSWYVSPCCIAVMAVCIAVFYRGYGGMYRRVVSRSGRYVSPCCIPVRTICIAVLYRVYGGMHRRVLSWLWRYVSPCCIPVRTICIAVLYHGQDDIYCRVVSQSGRYVSPCCITIRTICIAVLYHGQDDMYRRVVSRSGRYVSPCCITVRTICIAVLYHGQDDMIALLYHSYAFRKYRCLGHFFLSTHILANLPY